LDERRLEDAVDRVEIRALHDTYADIVSRRAWAELDDVFLPGTVLDLDLREQTLSFSGPADIGGFIAKMINQFEFFQFNILNTRVHLRSGDDPDRAASRMHMTELRQTTDGHWSQIYGVYHDRLRRVDGRWWFDQRTYHSLARNNLPAALFAFPDHIRLADL
jgi:SnoaL-like domain